MSGKPKVQDQVTIAGEVGYPCQTAPISAAPARRRMVWCCHDGIRHFFD